ncbi:hypothetical protein IF188_14725 [Microbacterium sp. NEAU-LLC]|uniref:Uncharacterized protein n=1 Tax=Microbacterium helvum TaxID=2773713 RepID=A0ABR8NQM9_9MICO|nr:hypothetical protein [Microbacterium helvum]MBD3942946.1 hypothetical protein [Microbacterium helvum]
MRRLVFPRIWAAVLVGCLPLLGLLLVPQLMRSRAGSESLLMIGVVALLVMLVAGVVLAPVMSAFAAPVAGVWQPRTALGATRRVWRSRRAQAWLALGLFMLIYAAGQTAGYALGSAVPYVHDNPAFPADPTASPWVIDYPAYALQAAVIYLVTTLGLAVYAARLRSLAVAGPVDVSARRWQQESAPAAPA